MVSHSCRAHACVHVGVCVRACMCVSSTVDGRAYKTLSSDPSSETAVFTLNKMEVTAGVKSSAYLKL